MRRMFLELSKFKSGLRLFFRNGRKIGMYESVVLELVNCFLGGVYDFAEFRRFREVFSFSIF